MPVGKEWRSEKQADRPQQRPAPRKPHLPQRGVQRKAAQREHGPAGHVPQRALLRSGEGEVQHHPAKGIESSGTVVLLDALRYGPQRFNGERSLPGGKRFKTAFIKPQDTGIFPQVHAQNVHFRLLIPGGTIIGGGQKPQCQKDGEKGAYRPPGQSLVHHNTSFAAGKLLP